MLEALGSIPNTPKTVKKKPMYTLTETSHSAQ
jgi:hypothetical protein